MTVAELIAALEKMPPDAVALVDDDGREVPVQSVIAAVWSTLYPGAVLIA